MRYCPLPLCILSTIVLFFNACNYKCDSVQEYPLENVSKYVSYTGYDTLRFLHNSTDTQVFIGEGINYFWVRKPAFDDTQCPEDHQSLSIQFRNHQNENTIKMEYVYDYFEFNNQNFLRFYFNGFKIGIDQRIYNKAPININGKYYELLYFFAATSDTSKYLAYSSPLINGYGGIVKIKQIGDTLTLIR